MCCTLLPGDRALQALRRGRWETPAELQTRHWESHSFVAHSSYTAVSFKQSLLSVTQCSSRACARRMFSCSVCDHYPPSHSGDADPTGLGHGWALELCGAVGDFGPALPPLTPPRERADQTSLSWAFHRGSSSPHPNPLFQSCSHPWQGWVLPWWWREGTRRGQSCPEPIRLQVLSSQGLLHVPRALGPP